MEGLQVVTAPNNASRLVIVATTLLASGTAEKGDVVDILTKANCIEDGGDACIFTEEKNVVDGIEIDVTVPGVNEMRGSIKTDHSIDLQSLLSGFTINEENGGYSSASRGDASPVCLLSAVSSCFDLDNARVTSSVLEDFEPELRWEVRKEIESLYRVL
jgi:hypothetical protein